MTLDYESDKVTNKKYFPSAAPHSAREKYTVTAKVVLDDQVDTGDLIGLAILPANCIPVDCALFSTDLGTDEILVDVGILNSAKDDLVPSSLLIDGSTICQAGGMTRMDDHECVFAPATWLAEATCPALSAEKTVALKVMTKATTPTAGTLYFKLDYRAAENGI